MFSKPCLNIIQLEYRVQPEWSSYVNTVTYNNGGGCAGEGLNQKQMYDLWNRSSSSHI